MPNVFDQFDNSSSTTGNPYDQFDVTLKPPPEPTGSRLSGVLDMLPTLPSLGQIGQNIKSTFTAPRAAPIPTPTIPAPAPALNNQYAVDDLGNVTDTATGKNILDHGPQPVAPTIPAPPIPPAPQAPATSNLFAGIKERLGSLIPAAPKPQSLDMPDMGANVPSAVKEPVPPLAGANRVRVEQEQAKTWKDRLSGLAQAAGSYFGAEPAHEFTPSGEDIARAAPTVAQGIGKGISVGGNALLSGAAQVLTPPLNTPAAQKMMPFPALTKWAAGVPPEEIAAQYGTEGGALNPIPEIVSDTFSAGMDAAEKLFGHNTRKALEDAMNMFPGYGAGFFSPLFQGIKGFARGGKIFEGSHYNPFEPGQGAPKATPGAPGMAAPNRGLSPEEASAVGSVAAQSSDAHIQAAMRAMDPNMDPRYAIYANEWTRRQAGGRPEAPSATTKPSVPEQPPGPTGGLLEGPQEPAAPTAQAKPPAPRPAAPAPATELPFRPEGYARSEPLETPPGGHWQQTRAGNQIWVNPEAQVASTEGAAERLAALKETQVPEGEAPEVSEAPALEAETKAPIVETKPQVSETKPAAEKPAVLPPGEGPIPLAPILEAAAVRRAQEQAGTAKEPEPKYPKGDTRGYDNQAAQKKFREFKTRLTRAQNAKDWPKVIEEAKAFDDYYNNSPEPFPDDRSRWARAKEDAEYALRREAHPTFGDQIEKNREAAKAKAAERVKEAKAPPPTLLSKEPPGGFTEADKVPPAKPPFSPIENSDMLDRLTSQWRDFNKRAKTADTQNQGNLSAYFYNAAQSTEQEITKRFGNDAVGKMIADWKAEQARPKTTEEIVAEAKAEQIDRIVKAASRKPLPIVEVREIKGTDGKWHSGVGMPQGVQSTGEVRVAGYAYRAENGTTVGTRMPSREEAEKAQAERIAASDENFRKELSQMPPERLQSQAEYWLKGEAPTEPRGAAAARLARIAALEAENAKLREKAPAAKPPAAKGKLLTPQQISDFRPGTDRVERRGDKTYVVSGDEYAPVQVQHDALTPETEANLRKLPPERLEEFRSQTKETPYLSPEGKAERLKIFDELIAGKKQPGPVSPREEAKAKAAERVQAAKGEPTYNAAVSPEQAGAVSFKAEFDDGSGFTSNALRFATKEEAELYADDLMGRWMGARDSRVVPSDEPVNRKWVRGKGAEHIDTEAEKAQINKESEAPNVRQPIESPSAVDVRQRAGVRQGTAGQEATAQAGEKHPGRGDTGNQPGEPTPGEGQELSGGAGGGAGGAHPERRPGVQRRPTQAPVTKGPAEGPRHTGAEGGVSRPPAQTRAEIDLEDAQQNHVLSRDIDWIPSGAKTKIRANLDAIKLVKELDAEDRLATPEEKHILARYTGWGAFPQMFDEGKAAYRKTPGTTPEQITEAQNWEKNWGALYDEVKAALTPEERTAASRSIRNAHFTSREVVNGVWDAVKKLGFTGGKALEPAVGVGNFIGLTPAAVRAKTDWTAIELDSISARIAKKLYPEANVIDSGFQNVPLTRDYDLVITNVPFAAEGPSRDANPRNLSLHNFFIDRSINELKPGGIAALITSDSTMDRPISEKARKLVAEKADLVGAIRLPNTAFKENAGTEVTTDILFFRKKDDLSHSGAFKGQPFTEIKPAETYKGEPIKINEYYVAHPDMMLGRMSLEGTMYRKPGEGEASSQALLPEPGKDLTEQLNEAINKLPKLPKGAGQILDEMVKGKEAKLVTFTQGTVDITTAQSGKASVDATVSDNFAIHRPLKSVSANGKAILDTKANHYRITHRGSGLNVGLEPRTIEQGKEWVKALENAGIDWSFTDQKDMPEEAKKRALALVQSLRKGEGATVPKAEQALAEFKPGSYVIDKDQVRFVTPEQKYETPEWAGDPKKVLQAKKYIILRDSALNLIKEQIKDVSDQELKPYREQLNKFYDEYVKRYGPINTKPTRFLEDDYNYNTAASLEADVSKVVQRKTVRGMVPMKQTSWEKSAIFTKRTGFFRAEPTHADTVEDGLDVSMNFRGGVEPDFIAELTGKPPEAVERSLTDSGLAFENPKTRKWESRAEYLSGFTKEKLALAKKAAERDRRFQPNVDELEKVQPEPISIDDIVTTLGADWIPKETVSDYIQDVLGIKTKIEYAPATSRWDIQPLSNQSTEANHTVYGVVSDKEAPKGQALENIVPKPGLAIIHDMLNGKQTEVQKKITVIDSDGREDVRYRKSDQKTLEAQEKRRQLQRKFSEFLRADDARSKQMEQIFNEKKNIAVLPQFPVPTWKHYPGANPEITLRDDQKAVVSRMMRQSLGVFHAPGNGKTYIAATAGMELRRLGLAKKVLYVVHNATSEQAPVAVRRLYPSADILAPTKRDFETQNRQRLLSRIATGDYDMIIIPQSFANLLPDSPQRMIKYTNDRLAELRDAIIRAQREGGERSITAKNLQKKLDKLEDRLKQLQKLKKDKGLTFEQLGIDAIITDEGHAYKSLEFDTEMGNIKGLTQQGGDRGKYALSMYMKFRHIQEMNNGRNTYLLTGTPINNTIGEAWTMIRFLRPDVLDAYGITNFDQFAATFGRIATKPEFTAAGTWQEVTRFEGFENAPVILKAWLEAADVVTQDMVHLPGLPSIKGGKPRGVLIKQSPEFAQYIKYLRRRLEDFAKMDGEEKRKYSYIPVVTYGLGAKASLDMRMVDPSAPDRPDSKISVAAKETAKLYKETSHIKGTQMVFADLRYDDPGDPKFDLYKAFKQKLVEDGVPADEIVIMEDNITGARRGAIIDAFRRGDVRVMIGHSERMGIGIDAPNHGVEVRHLDVPHQPMYIEQRNARLVRQNNENLEVGISTYGVDGSLDAARWQRLSAKQRAFDQLMRGNVKGKYVADPLNELEFSFQEQLALYSGDPRAAEKVQLETAVRQMTGLKKSHEQSVRSAKQRLPQIAKDIPAQKAKIAKAQATAKQLDEAFAKNAEGKIVPELEINGRKLKGPDAINPVLNDYLTKLIKSVPDGVGDYYGPEKHDLTLNGIKIQTRVYGPSYGATRLKEGKRNLDDAVVHWSFALPSSGWRQAVSSQGFFSGLGRELEYMADEPRKLAEHLGTLERNQRELKGYETQPFEREAELQKSTKRLDELATEMAKEGPAKEPSATEIAATEDAIQRYALQHAEHRLKVAERDLAKEEKKKPKDEEAADKIAARMEKLTARIQDLHNEIDDIKSGSTRRDTGDKGRIEKKGEPAIEPEEDEGDTGTLGFPELRAGVPDIPQHTRPLDRNFQPPSPAERVKLKRRGDIIRNLQEEFQIPIRTGHISSRRERGIFKVKEEVIRTKAANDVEAVAHEVGHYLSKVFFGRRAARLPGATELRTMGEALYGERRPNGGYAEEGFAEFVRFYVTEPDRARREAPTFSRYFQERMDSDLTDVRDVLMQSRADWRRYQEQPAVAKILSQVSIGEARRTPPWTLQGLYTQALDRLNMIRVFENRMNEGQPPLQPSDSPYTLSRVFSGWVGKAGEFLDGTGPLDFDTYQPLPGVKPLNKILGPFDEAGKLDDLRAYLIARSAADRIARNQKTGLDREAIRQTLDHFNAQPEFVRAAEDLEKYEDALLVYGAKAGLWSRAAILKMKTAHPHHVPFYRLMDEQQGGSGGSLGNKKFANLPNPIKRAKGSEREIIDPLESIVKNTYAFINVADRNVIGQKIIELGKRPGMGKYVEKIPRGKIPVILREEEIRNLIRDLGIDESEAGDIPREMVAAFRPNPRVPGNENILSVKFDGKPDLYQVHPDLYQAMAGLEQTSQNGLIKLLSIPAKTLRIGATMYSPEFSLRNPTRDAWTAALYSKTGIIPIPGSHFIQGLMHLLADERKGDAIYHAWKAGGGEHSMLVSLDRHNIQKTLQDVIDSGKASSAVRYMIRHPIDAARVLNEYGEAATRVGEFARVVKAEGGDLTKNTIIKGGYAARNVTLDFDRSGSAVRAWALNQLSAFFNPNLQGWDKMFREAHSRPGLFFARHIALLTIPSLLLWWMNKDDPRYDELPYWRKAFAWNFPIGHMDRETWKGLTAVRKAEFNRTHPVFWIPKAFTNALLFATWPEALLDWTYKNDPKALSNWLKSATGEIPFPIPTAAIPIVENIANWSKFRGRPIVPRNKEGVEPAYQYTDYTSGFAKAVGGAIGYSPAKIENFIQGWGGALGRLGLDATNLAFPKPTKGETPEKTLADIPVVRAFVARSPGQPESIERFYDKLEQSRQYKETWDSIKAENKQAEARKYFTAHRQDIVDAARLGQVSEQLKNMRKQSDQIANDSKLSAQAKRIRMDALTFRMIDIAKGAINRKSAAKTQAVNE